MIGRAWSNGDPSRSGAGYGIAVSKADRDANVDSHLKEVSLVLDGGERFRVRLSQSFWRDCPEFRSKEIGAWLLANGFAPWPKGRPPAFRIDFVEEGVFRVRPSHGMR